MFDTPLPDEPCTHDCRECVAQGRCLGFDEADRADAWLAAQACGLCHSVTGCECESADVKLSQDINLIQLLAS